MKRLFLAVVLLVLFCCGIQSIAATFKVNSMFNNNMILQRDMRNPVWGTATSGEKITIAINGQKYSVTADEKGKWMIRINALPVGGPYTMKINTKDKTIF